jgi:hypothetical protein
LLTEIGPVQIEVPRDRDRSFDPQVVRKRQRRLDGIEQIVISLTARGLTTGEIAAHFDEVYWAKVSKDTISRITDKVIEEMTEWRNRPLDRVCPVLFADAIVVKVRDGQVTNRPVYVATRIHGPKPPRTQIPNHHRTSRMTGQRQDSQARQKTSRSTSPGPVAETIIKGQAVDRGSASAERRIGSRTRAIADASDRVATPRTTPSLARLASASTSRSPSSSPSPCWPPTPRSFRRSA